jgi:hypothetical protein
LAMPRPKLSKICLIGAKMFVCSQVKFFDGSAGRLMTTAVSPASIRQS